MRGLLTISLAMSGVVLAGPSWAGDFVDDGSYVFDPKTTWRQDFETEVAGSEVDDPPIVRGTSSSALSGAWYAELAQFESAAVAVDLPALKRGYRASMWIRGGEASAFFVTVNPVDRRSYEVATMYPTGRITSDGWIELASDAIRIDGSIHAAVMGAFSPTGCEMDAFEVVSTQAIEGVVNPSCDGVVDNTCAIGQVCYWSECRNVASWVPPIPPDREDVTLYLENRLRFLFGPFENRTLDLPASLVAIEQMRHATDRWTYWNGFMLAVRRLHDGHTGTSGSFDFVVGNPKPLSVCFMEGEADLSPSTPSDPLYRDVLVSHTGADHNLGLNAGDRLVSVDGVHPLAWSRSLITSNWRQPAVSNHGTFAEHASRLSAHISRFADHIEVIRCSEGTCGDVETVSIRDIPFDEPGAPFDFVACDNRPLRHLPTSPEDHQGQSTDVFVGPVNEADAEELIYGAEWESLSTTSGQDGVGPGLKAAINTFINDGAKGVILDHRLGTGGTLAGPEIIWDFAVSKKPLTFTQGRPFAEAEQPSLAEGLELFNLAIDQNYVAYAGSSNPTTIPVALLITQDVSASDWLPLGLKGAPNVRIFGPYETNGAFSTRYQLGYWFGMNYVLATGDSFVASGDTQAGKGVAPDDVVLPLQSDLHEGRDTVFEAALAWVRAEQEAE